MNSIEATTQYCITDPTVKTEIFVGENFTGFILKPFVWNLFSYLQNKIKRSESRKSENKYSKTCSQRPPLGASKRWSLRYCKSRIFCMHVIFVYFVRAAFRTKIKCMPKVQSMPENLQWSATVRKCHAYERSESPGYENWVRTKYSGFTVLAGSIHWSNVKLTTEGDHKNVTMITSNVQNVRELKCVFLPGDFLASTCRQTFVGELHEKRRRFRIVTRSLYAGKTGWWCTENPVAGRARQMVAIRSAVSVWNCPCTNKRSLKAGGRWSQVLLKLKTNWGQRKCLGSHEFLRKQEILLVHLRKLCHTSERRKFGIEFNFVHVSLKLCETYEVKFPTAKFLLFQYVVLLVPWHVVRHSHCLETQ